MLSSKLGLLATGLLMAGCLSGLPDAAPTDGGTGGVAGSDGSGTDTATDGTGGGSGAGGTSGAGGGAGAAGNCSDYCQEVLRDGPIAYWRFGETTGPWAFNEINDPAPDGEYRGDVTLGLPGAIDGDPNTALQLGGSDSQVEFPEEFYQFVGRESYSLEVWINPNAVVSANYQYIVQKRVGGAEQGYRLMIRADGRLQFARQRDGLDEHIIANDESYALPLTYTHVVGTYDGNELCLYANGARVNNDCVPATRELLPRAQAFMVGSSGNGDRFVGTLDEVAIYNKALSEVRVQAHYAAAVP